MLSIVSKNQNLNNEVKTKCFLTLLDKSELKLRYASKKKIAKAIFFYLSVCFFHQQGIKLMVTFLWFTKFNTCSFPSNAVS